MRKVRHSEIKNVNAVRQLENGVSWVSLESQEGISHIQEDPL